MPVIIANGDVVTMNPTRDVLIGGSVVVDGSTIVAVGSTAALRGRASRRIDRRRDRMRGHAGHDQRPSAPDRWAAVPQLHPRPAVAGRVDLLVVGPAARCAHARRRRDVGHAVRRRVGAERGDHRGRGRHGRASGQCGAGHVGRRHSRHHRHVGLGHRGRPVRGHRSTRCSIGNERCSRRTRAVG